MIEAAFIVARFKDSGFGVDIQGLKLNRPYSRAGFSSDRRPIWPDHFPAWVHALTAIISPKGGLRDMSCSRVMRHAGPIWTTMTDTGHVNRIPDGQITLLTAR